MSHRYTDAKDAFIDEIKIDEYIELEGSKKAYRALEHSLFKSTKMVLLYGQPGTGKTLLLNRLYESNRDKCELHLLDTPTGSRKDFYKKLFFICTGTEMPPNTKVGLDTFIAYGRRIKDKRNINILVDEAQMYPKEILEEIRIISDTGAIKFIIALHKTEDEDLIVKKHFQSRIWESIELGNASIDEMKAYIHKRLLHHGLSEISNQIKDKHLKMIYRWTDGNFRECNKLLYTLFELYEYYDKHNPRKIDYRKISIKILEMSAIKTGFIDV